MEDNTKIKNIMDGAIDSWETKTVKNVIKLVIKIINDKCTSKFNEEAYAKCEMHDNKTSEQLRDEILAKYFFSKKAKEKIDFVSDKINLINTASAIISISENVMDVYNIATQYANGDDVDPDEALSEGLETISSIISLIPGTTYVTNVLSLGNDILEISAQMVKDYVSQYEQIEAMINGAEESDTISDADAAAITTVYNDITALANSGDIEVMNFAYGMLNDYGWFWKCKVTMIRLANQKKLQKIKTL